MDVLVYLDPSPRAEWALAMAAQLPAPLTGAVRLLVTEEDAAADPPAARPTPPPAAPADKPAAPPAETPSVTPTNPPPAPGQSLAVPDGADQPEPAVAR
jgi:hypothetical protein